MEKLLFILQDCGDELDCVVQHHVYFLFYFFDGNHGGR